MSLRNLNDVSKNTGILSNILTIDTRDEVFSIELGSSVNNVYNLISNKIMELSNKMHQFPSNSIESKTVDNIADELREYKKLLDEGIITDEDFNKKKDELLNL